MDIKIKSWNQVFILISFMCCRKDGSLEHGVTRFEKAAFDWNTFQGNEQTNS